MPKKGLASTMKKIKFSRNKTYKKGKMAGRVKKLRSVLTRKLKGGLSLFGSTPLPVVAENDWVYYDAIYGDKLFQVTGPVNTSTKTLTDKVTMAKYDATKCKSYTSYKSYN